jgi:hypothetical protein
MTSALTWLVTWQLTSALMCRGENGTGTRIGYRIRVLEIPEFSDTYTDNFVFGTDTGTIRLMYFRIRVKYGNTIPGKFLNHSGRIRVPGLSQSEGNAYTT